MPRDLQLENQKTLEGMAPLTKEPVTFSPEAITPDALDREPVDREDDSHEDRLMRDMRKGCKRDELHPFVTALSPRDVENCLRLEEAAFPAQEAATREKFEYRLSVCGELCLGLCTSSNVDSDESKPLNTTSTAEHANVIDSTAPQRKGILLAHIVSTKTTNELIRDEDMEIPESPSSKKGHQEQGRTIALHSLAVVPEFQGQGLGKTLMRSYIQRMDSSGVADRIAILTYDRLVPYYEKLGFVSKGRSKATYAGREWYDMVYDFHSAAHGQQHQLDQMQ